METEANRRIGQYASSLRSINHNDQTKYISKLLSTNIHDNSSYISISLKKGQPLSSCLEV